MTNDQILDEILRREGGYVNDPDDLGGATNFGITQATLADFRKKEVTAEDVRNLSVQEAKLIYSAKYILPFSSYSGDLLHLLVDSAVQHGVARVQGWLSELQTTDPIVVYNRVLKRRLRFYGEIISARPQNAKFAKGWMIRLSEFIV